MRLRPPPAQPDNDALEEWMWEVHDAFLELPTFSTFSTSDGPNTSGQTADRGVIGIDIGSSVTKFWFKNTDSSQTQGWVDYDVPPVSYSGGEISSAYTPDFDNGDIHEITLTGDIRIGNPQNVEVGGVYLIRFVQDSTGNRNTSSWGTAYRFQDGGTPPSLTTTANAVDVVTMVANHAGDFLDCVMQYNFAST